MSLPDTPSELLTRFASLLPARGRALDLACGSGRHAIFLAALGWRVVGIDRSWDALCRGRELARARCLSIDWVCADLETYLLPADAFDVIVCFRYRDPNLYPAIRASLRPGGFVIYETFTREQLRFGAGPSNPAHLLEPGELLRAFADWDVMFYWESLTERAMASLVARKPALQKSKVAACAQDTEWPHWWRGSPRCKGGVANSE